VHSRGNAWMKIAPEIRQRHHETTRPFARHCPAESSPRRSRPAPSPGGCTSGRNTSWWVCPPSPAPHPRRPSCRPDSRTQPSAARRSALAVCRCFFRRLLVGLQDLMNDRQHRRQYPPRSSLTLPITRAAPHAPESSSACASPAGTSRRRHAGSGRAPATSLANRFSNSPCHFSHVPGHLDEAETKWG